METVNSRYENYRLCNELKSSEICLVVQQYKEGNFIREFHKHIPRSQLSNDERINLLRSLVISFSAMSAETIVTCYLNRRGRKPDGLGPLPFFTSYPEPGVLRTYCGTDTTAWSDQVIVPSKFRQPDQER
jgi:hypothetical protein